MSKVVERFLRYIKYDTQSDDESRTTPSTVGQLVFARTLKEELEEIGLNEVSLDENGYLMATLESNLEEGRKAPTIGFIAHMDTSPDMSGKNVKPQLIKNYDGNDIILNEREEYCPLSR